MKKRTYSKLSLGLLILTGALLFLSGCSNSGPLLDPLFNSKPNEPLITEIENSNVFNVGDSIFADTKSGSYRSWIFGGYELSNAYNGKAGISIIHDQQDLSLSSEKAYTKIEKTPFHYLVEVGTILKVGDKKVQVVNINLDENTIEFSFLK